MPRSYVFDQFQCLDWPEPWLNLACFAVAESRCTVGVQITCESRFYISSLPQGAPNASVRRCTSTGLWKTSSTDVRVSLWVMTKCAFEHDMPLITQHCSNSGRSTPFVMTLPSVEAASRQGVCWPPLAITTALGFWVGSKVHAIALLVCRGSIHVKHETSGTSCPASRRYSEDVRCFNVRKVGCLIMALIGHQVSIRKVREGSSYPPGRIGDRSRLPAAPEKAGSNAAPKFTLWPTTSYA